MEKRYELFQGDCFELLKNIPDKSIDLVITDPPYLHNTSRSKGGHTALAKSDLMQAVLNNLSDFTPEVCFKMLDEIKRVMKQMDGYFFCNERLVGTYCKWADENKFLVNILTWNKPLSILNRNRFSTNCEYIVRIHTASGTCLNSIDFDKYPDYKKYYSKYQYYPQLRGKEKLHPTQKPTELIDGYIILSSKENDVILDPFMGSGSTGESALRLGRKFIGMELDEKYFNIAKERIEKLDN